MAVTARDPFKSDPMPALFTWDASDPMPVLVATYIHGLAYLGAVVFGSRSDGAMPTPDGDNPFGPIGPYAHQITSVLATALSAGTLKGAARHQVLAAAARELTDIANRFTTEVQRER